jgi:hypothetical protein
MAWAVTKMMGRSAVDRICFQHLGDADPVHGLALVDTVGQGDIHQDDMSASRFWAMRMTSSTFSVCLTAKPAPLGQDFGEHAGINHVIFNDEDGLHGASFSPMA